MDREISEGLYYRHFKNKWYKVITIAEHTETGEKLVVYQAQYDENKMYARPLEMFLEKVPDGKENTTGQIHRFESSIELGLSVEQVERIIRRDNSML